MLDLARCCCYEHQAKQKEYARHVIGGDEGEKRQDIYLYRRKVRGQLSHPSYSRDMSVVLVLNPGVGGGVILAAGLMLGGCIHVT